MPLVAASAAYDRVTERRRAVVLARRFREAEGLSIAQIADRLGRAPATVKVHFYDPTGEKAHAVKLAMSACAAAAARTPSRATARATPTGTASAAIRARSSGSGHESWSSRPCWPGFTGTESPRPLTTGHARTPTAAVASRSSRCAAGHRSPARRSLRRFDGSLRSAGLNRSVDIDALRDRYGWDVH